MATSMKSNAIGLEIKDYKGRSSTLCPGCGHTSIANQIVTVSYEMALKPYQVIKMSGIGCSSKSPAYFLGQSHGFNSLHGRMPSVTTGAITVNRSLRALAVSGDGDTGSIGLGQFKHVIRRNVPMVYVIENNGVYGLTKGQHSATQDEGVTQKYYGINMLPPVDLALEALFGGATFVARSFAGAPNQVREILKAALSHEGTAVIDIISPCVSFNSGPSSTKSYEYAKENTAVLHNVHYVPSQEEIMIDENVFEDEGEIHVALHDGSQIVLTKLGDDYDPTDRLNAMMTLEKAHARKQIVTGLIYIEPNRPTIHDINNVVDEPLVKLGESELRPSRAAFDAIMAHQMR